MNPNSRDHINIIDWEFKEPGVYPTPDVYYFEDNTGTILHHHFTFISTYCICLHM